MRKKGEEGGRRGAGKEWGGEENIPTVFSSNNVIILFFR